MATSTPLTGQWNNTVTMTSPVTDYVRELKQRPGGDIGVHGSTSLGRSLISARLVDQLRFVIPPTLAGHGRRLFDADSTDHLQQFSLVDVDTSPKGTLFLHYRSAEPPRE